jgi:hypothetical protein
LQRFYLDLNLGQLRFVFSEVMSTSTVTFGALTLQDAAVAPTAAFRLTGGVLQSTPALVEYTVNLTVADLDAIKGLTNIGSSVNTTFLAMEREAFVDKAGLQVVAVTSPAMQASDLTRDTTAPMCVIL